MSRRLLLRTIPLFALFSILVVGSACAAQIWSGRTFSFSKSGGANPALPANQDRITPLVWITRGNTQGIYNAYSEVAYSSFYSPAGTEWATGDAVNYSSLSFSPWELWNGSFPPLMVGVNAVVHLIDEDIYIDIRFDSWASGLLGGGGFSYHRASEPATPTRSTTWGRVKTLYR